jgi:Flp pilus assembly protein TadD
MPLLQPLLEITISLDPRRLSAYRFGAFFLGGTDQAWAERVVRQGIEANPAAWPLYQDLAFLCWRQGRYREAAEAYQSAARLPGAPAWLDPMGAVMLARGGAPEVARQILEQSCQTSRDRFVREVCQYQLSLLRQGDSAAPPPSKGARRGID